MNMEPLVSAVEAIMGYKVEYVPQTWVQDTDRKVVLVPEGDAEGLLHELIHWVVATDEERLEYNLSLDETYWEVAQEVPPKNWDPNLREVQTVYLSLHLFRKSGLGDVGKSVVYGGSGAGYSRQVVTIGSKNKAWAHLRASPFEDVLVEAVRKTWGTL